MEIFQSQKGRTRWRNQFYGKKEQCIIIVSDKMHCWQSQTRIHWSKEVISNLIIHLSATEFDYSKGESQNLNLLADMPKGYVQAKR